MRLVVFLLISLVFIYSKEYSIIAYSSIIYNDKVSKKFLKRFPNGVIKKYSKFIEYKIEPFKNYKEAKNYLHYVRKYYKSAFIVEYNPYLGKVISYNKSIKKFSHYSNTIKTVKYESIIYDKKNQTKVINKNIDLNFSNNININVPTYFEEKNITVVTQKRGKTFNNNICKDLNYSDYTFYTDLYGTVFRGQKDKNFLKGNEENLKLGLIYEKYFLHNWRFFTDDRIIFSKKKSKYKSYLDIRELYINSNCLNKYSDILIGRKREKDTKSWLYDASFDEIKLFHNENFLNYELFLATKFDNMFNNDTNKNIKHIKLLVLHSNYEIYYNNNLELFYIYENSKQLNRINNILAFEYYKKGLQSFYWINGAINKVNNKILNKHGNGIGIDLGYMYNFDQNSTIGANYAYGSKNYRQPTVASNNSKFLNTLLKYRYYGYILDPFIDNLQIISFYYLYKFDLNNEIIASLHNFRQNSATQQNFDSRYLFNTSGTNKNIGNEIDVVYQYLIHNNTKLKIGASYFVGNGAYEYLNKKNVLKIFANYKFYWK